jgi:hypothetical protein
MSPASEVGTPINLLASEPLPATVDATIAIVRRYLP